ncbi:MAG TPA: DUF177 domain-containing protein [Candidatus Dormibacteraeota bacterium]|nr:DUF177 domain-containing protein [Candidatus Dormibacteraeota bacterium]
MPGNQSGIPGKRYISMFLDVKDLAVRKIRIRKSYAPGSVDYHTGEFRQVEPLEVRATAELIEGQIRATGELHTRLEMPCARCLEPLNEDVTREFDLFYRPLSSMTREEEERLKLDDTEIAFFEGDGMFLADILAEQVLLALPMKAICRSDCRGLCPQCGVNLNNEECRCESHVSDTRMAPLSRLKQDWFKKQ